MKLIFSMKNYFTSVFFYTLLLVIVQFCNYIKVLFLLSAVVVICIFIVLKGHYVVLDKTSTILLGNDRNSDEYNFFSISD